MKERRRALQINICGAANINAAPQLLPEIGANQKDRPTGRARIASEQARSSWPDKDQPRLQTAKDK